MDKLILDIDHRTIKTKQKGHASAMFTRQGRFTAEILEGNVSPVNTTTMRPKMRRIGEFYKWSRV